MEPWIKRNLSCWAWKWHLNYQKTSHFGIRRGGDLLDWCQKTGQIWFINPFSHYHFKHWNLLVQGQFLLLKRNHFHKVWCPWYQRYLKKLNHKQHPIRDSQRERKRWSPWKPRSVSHYRGYQNSALLVNQSKYAYLWSLNNWN